MRKKRIELVKELFNEIGFDNKYETKELICYLFPDTYEYAKSFEESGNAEERQMWKQYKNYYGGKINSLVNVVNVELKSKGERTIQSLPIRFQVEDENGKKRTVFKRFWYVPSNAREWEYLTRTWLKRMIKSGEKVKWFSKWGELNRIVLEHVEIAQDELETAVVSIDNKTLKKKKKKKRAV